MTHRPWTWLFLAHTSSLPHHTLALVLKPWLMVMGWAQLGGSISSYPVLIGHSSISVLHTCLLRTDPRTQIPET